MEKVIEIVARIIVEDTLADIKCPTHTLIEYKARQMAKELQYDPDELNDIAQNIFHTWKDKENGLS